MSCKIFDNLIRLVAVGAEHPRKRARAYSGDDIRLDVVFQQGLHDSQMSKSFDKSPA